VQRREEKVKKDKTCRISVWWSKKVNAQCGSAVGVYGRVWCPGEWVRGV
jgi:hypothetical protein